MSVLLDVPADRQCGATTRDGDACKNWAMRGRTRCRMHGGKSRRGMAAPRYQHGFYSQDFTCRVLWIGARRGGLTTRIFAAEMRAAALTDAEA